MLVLRNWKNDHSPLQTLNDTSTVLPSSFLYPFYFFHCKFCQVARPLRKTYQWMERLTNAAMFVIIQALAFLIISTSSDIFSSKKMERSFRFKEVEASASKLLSLNLNWFLFSWTIICIFSYVLCLISKDELMIWVRIIIPTLLTRGKRWDISLKTRV